MSKGTSLMLPKGWPGEFHRTVKGADGDRTLTFQPGQITEVSAEDMDVVRNDVGTALHFAKVDKGAAVPKMDGAATRKFVEENKARNAKEEQQRLAEKEAAAKTVTVEIPASSLKATETAKPVAARKDIETKGK